MFNIIKILYQLLEKVKMEIILQEWRIILPLVIVCFLLGAIIIFLWNKEKIDFFKCRIEYLDKQLLEKDESLKKCEVELNQFKDEKDTFQATEKHQRMKLKEYALDLVNELNEFQDEIKKQSELIYSTPNQSEEYKYSLSRNLNHRKIKEYQQKFKYKVRKVRCMMKIELNQITKDEDCKDSFEQERLDIDGNIELVSAIKTEIEILASYL
jgi:hypothetical protein